jgi:hypothetical protein
MITFRIRAAVCLSIILASALSQAAQAQLGNLTNWRKLPDRRGEFVRLCSPHMIGRWAHPEAVCVCLHDHAVASVEDEDLRAALLRGISERGVPSLEKDWIPASKQPMISAAFSQIAKSTWQCMYEPVPD